MDEQSEINPPDLLPASNKSPKFSCFLDCCKPKKQSQWEEKVAPLTANRAAGVTKSKVDKPTTGIPPATSEAVMAPPKHGLSPKAFMEFLKMLLSFLLIESLGKKGKSKSEKGSGHQDEKQEQEDIPILEG